MFISNKCSQLLLIALSLLITSCEKVNNEYSNYVISVDNETTTSYNTDLYLDGEYKQTVILEANRQASYINSCNETAVPAAMLSNTFIIKEVKPGEHKVELKSDDDILKTLSFTVKDENCIMQFTILE